MMEYKYPEVLVDRENTHTNKYEDQDQNCPTLNLQPTGCPILVYILQQIRI